MNHPPTAAVASAAPTPIRTSAATSPSAAVVVGVAPDGSGTSAVVWAVEDAEREGHQLRMVTAHARASTDGPLGRHDLLTLARRLSLRPLEHREIDAPAATALLAAAADASLLVIGRRELTGLYRRLVGGISLSVSARAPIPIVVVPEPWMQPEMSAAPIVLGIEPRRHRRGTSTVRTGDPARAAIDFAFARVARMRVPLHVVAAVRAGPDAMDRGQLEHRLESWISAYPTVEVRVRTLATCPTSALHIAAQDADAQLVVVGRHCGDRPPGGGLGATTRALLRDLRRPLAVIPPAPVTPPTSPPTPKEK